MDILKDVAALEQLFDKEINNYHSTPGLQGKKWYGLGLEDNASNNQKDDSNKKNVIRRMIDAILGFISRILKKIKDFFFVSEDQQKLHEAGKQYTGPTDKDTVKATKKYAEANKANKDTTDKTAAAPNLVISPDDSVDVALEKAAKITGKAVNRAKIEQFMNGEKMALISAMLGEDRMAIISAMLSSEYPSEFKKALELISATVKKPMDNENLTDEVDEFNRYTKKCREIIEEHAKQDRKKLVSELSNWVMGKNLSKVDQIHSYFNYQDLQKKNKDITDYMEHLSTFIESIRNDPSDEALASIDKYRYTVFCMAKFVALEAEMDSAYCTVIRGLLK